MWNKIKQLKLMSFKEWLKQVKKDKPKTIEDYIVPSRNCSECKHFELEGMEAVCNRKRIILEDNEGCIFYEK